MPVRGFYQHENGPHSVYGFRVGRFNFGINTTFIVYRIGTTLIDTGPSNQWKEVRSQLEGVDVRQLLITHHHEDHSGNGQRIADLKNLTPAAPVQGQEKLATGYYTPPMQRMIWGKPRPVKTRTLPEELTLEDGTPVIAVHTPGHAKDLTCLYFPEQKYLFSGDMYISQSLKYFRADENLEQLIGSLEKLLKLDIGMLFCPHRGIVENGYDALREKRDNLIDLCRQAQSLARQGMTEKQITLELLGPEDWIARLSGENISKGNLIRQAMVFPLSQY